MRVCCAIYRRLFVKGLPDDEYERRMAASEMTHTVVGIIGRCARIIALVVIAYCMRVLQ